MLKHELPEDAQSSPALPAAQRRVTPEELSAALEVLESSRQEQARQIQQTVAIGDVVQELDLGVTPEEVWQQVEAQRARRPAGPPPAAKTTLADTVNETLHVAAQSARKAAGQAAAAAQSAAAEARTQAGTRHVRPRGSRRGNGIAFGVVIGLACLGVSLFSAGHGLVVNGDNERATYSGYHKVAVVNGDGSTITLRGNCGTVVVNGDHDTIKVLGSVGRVVVDGEGDTVTWAQEPSGQTPSIVDNGDGNHIALAPAAPAPLDLSNLPPLPEPLGTPVPTVPATH